MYKVLILLMISVSLQAKPRVRFSTDKINFGTIYQGQVLTRDISIQNDFDNLVTINGIYESCGCLFVREDKMDIPPKSSKTFKVTFDSTFFKGRQTKYIDVLTSEHKRNIYRIVIKANIIQNFEISPPVLVLNQQQVRGKEPIRLALKNKTQKNVQITDVMFDKNIYELRSKSHDRIELRIKSSSSVEFSKTNIRIVTDDQYLKEFPVPVRLGEEHIQYSSNFVDFGTVEDKFSRKELRLDFDRSVDIKDIVLNSSRDIEFRYDLRKSRKNERRIRMYVKNSKHEKGNFKCDIKIKTSDSELGDLNVPCFGYFE